jgi:hypothetical protein
MAQSDEGAVAMAVDVHEPQRMMRLGLCTFLVGAEAIL